jgi:uncharacterized SAM-binding protein YcdF (DUF218 family)
MRALTTDIVHFFFSLPLYLLLALALSGVAAWRAESGARLRRWRHVLVVLAMLVYAVSAPAIPAAITAWIESRYPVPELAARQRRPDNVIIVLTAGWLRSMPAGFEQKIGEAGWERTAVAVDLWRQIGGRLLFSGAPAPDAHDSAAAAMARLARALGVPDDALLVEPASLNTHENLLYSKRLLGEGRHTLWLVTSAIHMPRSVAAARSLGLEVIPYPCDFRADQRLTWRTLIPANDALPMLERALHELVGMAVYRLRGWN